MLTDEHEARKKLVHVAQAMYARHLVTGAGGNVSLRWRRDKMLISAGGVAKGRMQASDILLCDLDGRVLDERASGRPSSEYRMHSYVYRQRTGVDAILHAHPAHAVALSLIGVSLEAAFLPESLLCLGEIAVCPYATPTTRAVVDAIAVAVDSGRNAFVLERHGTLTLGKDLEEAFVRLETLEHVAQVMAIACSCGKPAPLASTETARLKTMAGLD